MVRSIVTAVVGIAVGAVLGAVLVQKQYEPKLEAATARARELMDNNAVRNVQHPDLLQENEELKSKLAILEKTIANRSVETGSTGEDPLAALNGGALDNQTMNEEAFLEEALGSRAKQRPAVTVEEATSSSHNDESGEDNITAEELARREQRRQQIVDFMERQRQRGHEFINSQILQTADPAVQERLGILGENIDYMIDLMQEMRRVEDNQDRIALQQEYTAARDNVRVLVEQQQNHMLRQLAAENGITDPAAQDALIHAFRRVESSPFFRTPTLLWGIPNGPADQINAP
jgi:hypothetical protein